MSSLVACPGEYGGGKCQNSAWNLFEIDETIFGGVVVNLQRCRGRVQNIFIYALNFLNPGHAPVLTCAVAGCKMNTTCLNYTKAASVGINERLQKPMN